MNTSLYTLFLWALALLISCVVGVRADDAVEIVQRWIPGKTYTFTRTMHQEVEIAKEGQKLKRTDENTSEMAAKAELEEGKLVLDIRIEHVVEKKEIGEQTITYDSAKPDGVNSPAAAAFGALVGREFKIPLDEKGKPIRVEKVGEGVSPDVESEVIGKINESMRLVATPGHPVKPGDQWPIHISMESQFGAHSVDGNMVLRSVGIHDGVRCAEISETGKISMRRAEKEKEAAPSSPAATNIEIENGEIVGTIWFDLSLGAVREAELNQAMTVVRRNPTDPTKTLSVPVKQLARMKLIKAEDTK